MLFDAASGGNSAETATVTQTVDIPAGAVATLTYFLRAANVTSPANTTLTASVDGAIVQTINEPPVAEAAYSAIAVDLSGFAGGTRTITFTYSRPAGTSGSDTFLLDDVTLATSCGQPLVNISGRVTTPTGLALRNALVILTDSTNVRRTATTSSFGLYAFDNVRLGEQYILTVSSKRFRFSPRIQAFTSSLTNVDFVGLE